MDIKVYKEFNSELEMNWSLLEKNSYIKPFQRYIWLKNWAIHVGLKEHQVELCIICLFNKGSADMILPLGVRTAGQIKILEWLGGIHSDYMMPLVRKDSNILEDNFSQTWNEVSSLLPSHDLLHFKKQPSRIGPHENPFLKKFRSKFSYNSYQTLFDEDWKSYKLQNINKKVLADSRRQKRRLEELGKLEFEVITITKNNTDLLEEMFLNKRCRYKEMGVEDVLKNKQNQNFYINMPNELGSSSTIHFSTLRLDKEIIAMHWGAVDLDTFYYLMPAHSGGEWSKYSPGKLLLEFLMDWCQEHNVISFDFTGGDEDYKKIWSNESVSLSESLESFSFKGNLYLVFINLRSVISRIPFIKKIYKFIRPS